MVYWQPCYWLVNNNFNALLNLDKTKRAHNKKGDQVNLSFITIQVSEGTRRYFQEIKS